MENIYIVCVVVSIGMIIWLRLFDVRNSITQYMNLVLVIITCFGYYFLAISDTLDEALFAQITTYVGGAFLPLYFFIMVSEICHIEISKSLRTILVLCQWCIFGTVCTIGRSDIFYRNVRFVEYHGSMILEKDYGPCHKLAIGSMYIYLLCAFVVVIYATVKKKSVDRRSAVKMLVFMTLAIGVYAFEKIYDIKFDVLPIAYDVLMISSLIPIYDSNIFTAYENRNIIQEQLSRVAFLTFDTNKAYKGCNECMEKIFPELSQYKLRQSIRYCSEDLDNLISRIDNLEREYSKSEKREHIHHNIEAFQVGDRYYDGMIHILTNPFGMLKGYTIELMDSTEHHTALALRERYSDELAKEVKEKTRRIKDIQENIILGMAQMVESRDLSTGGHIKRTSYVVKIFAKKLEEEKYGLSPEFLDLVIRSAPMHDLGKIGVDDAVLRKQGRFTDSEYNEMKKHSEIGYYMVGEILSDVEEPEFVYVAENVAHYHHEKVDGSGYPEGLKGEDIPIEARIMALADVFDALVSKRCYKEAFSYDTAFEIIEKDMGTHFDESLTKVFLSCRDELEEYYNHSE